MSDFCIVVEGGDFSETSRDLIRAQSLPIWLPCSKKTTRKNNSSLILLLSPSNRVFHYSFRSQSPGETAKGANNESKRQDWRLCQRMWLQAAVCAKLWPCDRVIMEPRQVEPGEEDGASSSWHSWKSLLFTLGLHINQRREEPFNYSFNSNNSLTWLVPQAWRQAARKASGVAND